MQTVATKKTADKKSANTEKTANPRKAATLDHANTPNANLHTVPPVAKPAPIDTKPERGARGHENALHDAELALADGICFLETVIDATERSGAAWHVTLLSALERFRKAQAALEIRPASVGARDAKPAKIKDVNPDVQCALIDARAVLRCAIEKLQTDRGMRTDTHDVECAVSGASTLLEMLERRFDGELRVFEVE